MVNGGNVTKVTFNGGAAKTVSGRVTFTLNCLTLSAGGNNRNINRSIQVNDNINFAAAGLLIVNSSSNITLSATLTITGFRATHYIQLDQSSSANGQLIRQTTTR